MTHRIGEYRWRDIWPRPDRAGRSLPPGQRVARVMPRFLARPAAPPPKRPPQLEVTVRGDIASVVRLGLTNLSAIPRAEVVADFHCVTTWTVTDLRWNGWRLRDVWHKIIVPEGHPENQVTHLQVHGADGYWAVLDLHDALEADVLLADSLEGAALDDVHGAPLRLVSPRQYGYKSVKHVGAITVHIGEPHRYGGAMEHPRARVALEERHAGIPGQLLRWPYRGLIIPIAAVGAWSASRRPR